MTTEANFGSWFIEWQNWLRKKSQTNSQVPDGVAAQLALLCAVPADHDYGFCRSDVDQLRLVASGEMFAVSGDKLVYAHFVNAPLKSDTARGVLRVEVFRAPGLVKVELPQNANLRTISPVRIGLAQLLLTFDTGHVLLMPQHDQVSFDVRAVVDAVTSAAGW